MAEEVSPPPTPKSPKGELARLKRIFDLLDEDNDGAIPLKDFRTAMTDESLTARQLTEEQRQTLLRKADKHQDRQMNFREFALLTTSSQTEANVFRRCLYRVADVIIPEGEKPQVHSYLSQYSCCPPPLFMLAISVAEIAVFLYYTTSQGLHPGWFNGCGGCYNNKDLGIGPLPFSPSHRYQAWRFISYLLVHAGIQHILSNIFVQLVLGIPLELVHTILRVGPLYLAGVVLGSLLQYVLDPNVILVGASGGVYALLFAHLANLILNWAEMPFRWFRLGGLGAFLAFDIGHVIYRRIALSVCDQISYTAHIGGSVAGLLLGVALLRNIHTLKWEKVVKWVGLGLYLAIMVFAIIMTIVIKPGESAIFTTRCVHPTLAPEKE